MRGRSTTSSAEGQKAPREAGNRPGRAIRPALRRKPPVFLHEPASFTGLPKMGRVEYDQREFSVPERNVPEIGDKVRMDPECPPVAERGFHVPDVAENDTRIMAVVVEHPSAAAYIEREGPAVRLRRGGHAEPGTAHDRVEKVIGKRFCRRREFNIHFERICSFPGAESDRP